MDNRIDRIKLKLLLSFCVSGFYFLRIQTKDQGLREIDSRGDGNWGESVGFEKHTSEGRCKWTLGSESRRRRALS